MKFICEKNILSKGINSVINGISVKRDTILEGILITTKDNMIVLNTYNEEIGIEYKINANILEKGAIVVQAHTFAEIIRKLPDTNIEIYLDKENNLLAIECEGSKYKLATMKAEDFPELPKVDAKYNYELEQRSLRSAIKQTIFAVGTDEKRKLYTGCLFDVEKDKLNVVAVDGYRLAIRTIPINSENEFKMVVPGKTLSEISKILDDSFDNLRVGYAENQAIFEFENCKIITKLLEGEFLNYKSIIEAKGETKVKINRMLLQDSLERVMLISSPSVAKEKKEPVDITLEIGKMIISCVSTAGIAKEELIVETEGQEIKLKFNPKFILDVLRNITDEEIFIDFGTSIKPTNIKPIEKTDAYSYIILPMKTRD